MNLCVATFAQPVAQLLVSLFVVCGYYYNIIMSSDVRSKAFHILVFSEIDFQADVIRINQ